ncbi:MAG TPA: cupin domain-containing protein [Candidatus Limnocylindria bacterium]|nr:cupin domain-containing protein [Candidatus Limnocylindria bacterium]
MNEQRLQAEADDVYGWSNGPNDRYARHVHAYTKFLYCVSGSIDFTLADRVIHLAADDRMVLPAGTPHSATVGPSGCACVEGKARARTPADSESGS